MRRCFAGVARVCIDWNIRRAVVLLFVVAFLAACSGSSSSGEEDVDDASSDQETATETDGDSDTVAQSRAFLPGKLVGLGSEEPGTLKVEWLPGSNNEGEDSELIYEVHASLSDGFEPDDTTLQHQVVGQVSTVLSGLEPGERYQVLVVTDNTQGRSGTSNRLRGVTNSISPVMRSDASVTSVSESDDPVVSESSISIDSSSSLPDTGSIIASDAGEGFFRRVVASSTDNGRHTLETKPASLDEVLEEFEINTSARLAAPLPDSRTAGSRNITTRSRGVNEVVHEWDTGLRLQGTPLPAQRQHSGRAIQPRDTNATLEDDELMIDARYAQVFAPASLGLDPTGEEEEERKAEIEIRAVAKDEVSGWFWSSSEVDVTVCSIDFDSISHPDEAIEASANQTLPSIESTGEPGNAYTQRFEWQPNKGAIDAEARPHKLSFRVKVAESGQCEDSPIETISVDVPVYVIHAEQLAFEEQAVEFASDNGSLTITNRLNFNIEPEIDVGAKVRLSGVERARMIAEIDNFSLKQNLLIVAEGADDFSKTHTIIPERTFIRVVTAGPVPIVIVGRFELYAKLEADVSGEINLEQFMGLEFPSTRFGMQYADGSWNTIEEFNPEFSFQLEGRAEATKRVKATLIPDMSISFYEVASGRMLVEPYLIGRSDIEGQFLLEAGTAGQQADADYWFNNLEVGGGLDLRLSAGLGILSTTLVSFEPSPITIIEETPFAKLPELSTSSTPLEVEQGASHKKVHIHLSHTDTSMPSLFGGGSFWAKGCWAVPKVITQQQGYTMKSANSMSCDDEYIFEYSEPGLYEIRSTASVTNLPSMVRPITRHFLTLIDPEIIVGQNQINVTWEEESGVSYNLFVTSDPNCDVSNYSICSNAQMIPNATSGVNVTGLSADTSYYVILERIAGTDSHITTSQAYPVVQTVNDDNDSEAENKFLYFVKSNDGAQNIYRVNWNDLGEVEPIKLTDFSNEEAIQSGIQYSESLNQIAFIVRENSNRDSANLFFMEPDGSNLRQAIDDPVYSFSISPDGTEVIYALAERNQGDNGNKVYVADLNAGSRKMVLDAHEPRDSNTHKTSFVWYETDSIIFSDTLVWSDFQGMHNIHQYSLSSSSSNPIQSNSSSGDRAVSLSPDGSKLLVYMTMMSGQTPGRGASYINWPDDTGQVEIIERSLTYRVPVGWVNNDKIIYSKAEAIKTTNLSNTETENLTESYGVEGLRPIVVQISSDDSISGDDENLVMGRYKPMGGEKEIIRDVVTGLEWQRCSVGQTWTGNTCSGTASTMTWYIAESQVAAGGFRLPTLEELRTIVYCSNTDSFDSNGDNSSCGSPGTYQQPTISEAAFPNTPARWYWSSSTRSSNSNEAWMFGFGIGASTYVAKGSDGYRVRLVRAGP